MAILDNPTALKCISTVCTLLLGLVGIVSATHTEWVVKHRSWVISACVCLSIVVITAEWRQDAIIEKRASDAQQTINHLLERMNDELTGGDSWAYLMFSFQPNPLPVIFHVGDAALPTIQIRVFDARLGRNAAVHHIDRLGSGLAYSDPNFHVPFNGSDSQFFNVFFTTVYSRWTENLLLERVSGNWERAVRVTRASDGCVLMRCVTKAFPRDKLIDDDWEPQNCSHKSLSAMPSTCVQGDLAQPAR